jgi:hypothetical protein
VCFGVCVCVCVCVCVSSTCMYMYIYFIYIICLLYIYTKLYIYIRIYIQDLVGWSYWNGSVSEATLRATFSAYDKSAVNGSDVWGKVCIRLFPHTTTYICPHTTICVRKLLHVSAYYDTCFRILLCHHTTIYVSSYYYYTDALGKVFLHKTPFAELTFSNVC